MADFEQSAHDWANGVKARISVPPEATEVAAVSIAISLKRIADALEKQQEIDVGIASAIGAPGVLDTRQMNPDWVSNKQ